MNISLTNDERNLIVISLITRSRHVEKLIHDWEQDLYSPIAKDLVESYTNEKAEIEALRQKYVDLN